jgi:PilZ domain
MTERRKHQRDELMDIVRYAPSPDTSDTVLRGLLKDYSNSGICLLTNQPLDQGQEIIVNHMIVPGSKKATVRWQQNIGKSAYQIGLEFVR